MKDILIPSTNNTPPHMGGGRVGAAANLITRVI